LLPNDPLANILFIDLTKKSFRIDRREELFETWIGGTGVATRLLLSECPAGCDPLGPDNPIIFSVGPITSEFPLASKTVSMFKSPLTGDLGESHCGGRSAVSIRMAGFGSIVITGKSDIPVYLSIKDKKVVFKNATTLWGMNSTFTAGKIIRQAEGSEEAGLRTIMRIGRAGEKQIPYSCVTTETFRHFGRLGLGAVFGSKNLKAIVVSGRNKFPVTDFKEYRKLYDELYDAAVKSSVMKKYHDVGTSVNINVLNGIGALPTRNVQSGTFEDAGNISGEHLAENFLGRRLACTGCPTACIHIAHLREPSEDEAYFYKTTSVSYDHELIFSSGSMLGIGNPEHFLYLMGAIERAGLDAMSAGVAMAWATEAFKNGLISEEQTAGLVPEWGDHLTYAKMIDAIVDQPTDFYKDLALGAFYASGVWGGREYAMTFGKNEMAGYHTGPGCYIGYSIGARHSHLDNAGYSVDQKKLMEQEQEISPEDVVDGLVKEEEWRQVLSSLVVCFFARGIYTPEIVERALTLCGYHYSADSLNYIGRKIHRAKYEFKMREGFTIDDDFPLPARAFETPSPVSYNSEDYVRRALARFHEILQAD
jgi:aldehyde:ferredoxin oxidoreductase